MHEGPLSLERLGAYIHSIGLDGKLSAGAGQLHRILPYLSALTELPRSAGPLEDLPSLEALYRYRVPKLGAGGACSMAHELEEQPFDLRGVLGLSGVHFADLAEHPETQRLQRVQAVAALLSETTRADWTGIYRLEPSLEGVPTLVKEAYRGRPSRALFPCTEEFAKTSNNATAVRSGKIILVEDVMEHIAAGKPYYECDAEVRSELCMPIMEEGAAIGLIDLEAFRPKHFNAANIFIAALTALYLVSEGLLRRAQNETAAEAEGAAEVEL